MVNWGQVCFLYYLLLLKYVIRYSIVFLSSSLNLSYPDNWYSNVLLSLILIYSLNIWSKLILNKLHIFIKISYDGFALSCSISLIYLTDTSIASANFSWVYPLLFLICCIIFPIFIVPLSNLLYYFSYFYCTWFSHFLSPFFLFCNILSDFVFCINEFIYFILVFYFFIIYFNFSIYSSNSLSNSFFDLIFRPYFHFLISFFSIFLFDYLSYFSNLPFCHLIFSIYLLFYFIHFMFECYYIIRKACVNGIKDFDAHMWRLLRSTSLI